MLPLWEISRSEFLLHKQESITHVAWLRSFFTGLLLGESFFLTIYYICTQHSTGSALMQPCIYKLHQVHKSFSSANLSSGFSLALVSAWVHLQRSVYISNINSFTHCICFLRQLLRHTTNLVASTTEMYCLPLLQPRNLRSKCWWHWFL